MSFASQQGSTEPNNKKERIVAKAATIAAGADCIGTTVVASQTTVENKANTSMTNQATPDGTPNTVTTADTDNLDTIPDIPQDPSKQKGDVSGAETWVQNQVTPDVTYCAGQGDTTRR